MRSKVFLRRERYSRLSSRWKVLDERVSRGDIPWTTSCCCGCVVCWTFCDTIILAGIGGTAVSTIQSTSDLWELYLRSPSCGNLCEKWDCTRSRKYCTAIECCCFEFRVGKHSWYVGIFTVDCRLSSIRRGRGCRCFEVRLACG